MCVLCLEFFFTWLCLEFNFWLFLQFRFLEHYYLRRRPECRGIEQLCVFVLLLMVNAFLFVITKFNGTMGKKKKKAMFHKFDRKTGNDYRQSYRTIVGNLRDKNNPDLNDSLFKSDITPPALVSMTPFVKKK